MNTSDHTHWNYTNQVIALGVPTPTYNSSSVCGKQFIESNSLSPKSVHLPITQSQRPPILTEQRITSVSVGNSSHISKDISDQNILTEGDYIKKDVTEINAKEQFQQFKRPFKGTCIMYESLFNVI